MRCCARPAWIFGAPLSGVTALFHRDRDRLAAFAALALAAGFGWRKVDEDEETEEPVARKPAKKEAKVAQDEERKRTRPNPSRAASFRSAGSTTSPTASRRASRCCR